MDSPAPKLRHVSDTEPGIRRQRRGSGFSYLGTGGKPVRAERERERFKALGIPPAWTDVWICRDPLGHIQATGLDAAGRKQYRYHPQWSEWREQVKYHQLQAFGAALPALRRRVQRDLGGPPGESAFSIAALLLLLDHAHLRIGSRRHTRRSGTFGATTLRGRHIQLRPDGSVRLNFKGKGGKRVQRTLRDKRLHRALQQVDDLPGREFFTWVDADGGVHPVTSQQVNAYLAETVGVEGVSAKTFRTWAGSVAAVAQARRGPPPLTILSLTTAAAERLHNTPAICRKSYIHPLVLALVQLPAEELAKRLGERAPGVPRGLDANEQRLLRLLAEAAAAE